MARRQSDDYIDIVSNDPRLDRKLRRHRKKKRRTAKQKAVRAISVIAIIIAIGVVGYLFAANTSFFGKRLNVEIGTPDELKKKSVSFLVCGVDFEEGTGRAHLTDVQMYVNFDIKKGKINILQIPRDTYITREETSTGKINAVYGRPESYGTNGIDGLSEYIHKAFKLPVDHYATVNMTTFKKIIDEIGGVEVDVPTTITLEGVTIKKGLQTLDGTKAERFVRFRKGYNKYYNGSDINRQSMQRIFMAALAKKLKATPIGELVKVLTPIMANKEVTTDLTLNDARIYLGAMQKVDLKDMKVEMLPGESCYTSYGQSVYSLHKQETADLLNNRFRPYGRKYTADELIIEEIKNTTNYYTNNGDGFDDLLTSGYLPGQHKVTSSAQSSEQ